jgi:hypothetical protein
MKSKAFFFHAAAMFSFDVMQRIVFPSVLCFPKMFKLTSLRGHTTSGASVDRTSQVCSSAMLGLPIIENCEARFYGVPQWHKSVPDLIQICSVVLELNQADGRTDRHDQPYMRSLHAHRAKHAQQGKLELTITLKMCQF